MARVTAASDERTIAVTLIAMTIDRIASTILSWVGTGIWTAVMAVKCIDHIVVPMIRLPFA